MLASITSDQLLEWMVYEKLEPFGEDRGDLRAAQVVQALYHIALMRVRPEPYPLDRFRLSIGDWRPTTDAEPAARGQTVAQQERMLDAWIIGSNARIRAGGRA
jgi:hypothetical protein